MTLTSTGLGIGTTAPVEPLQVKGNVSVGDGSSASVDLRFHSIGGDGTTRLRGAGDTLQAYIGNQERMRVDSSGRLLVGTSSSPSIGQGQYAYLVVQGNTAGATSSSVLSLQKGVASASVGANDYLGELDFGGSDGGTFAQIAGVCDGTAGSGDYPGRLIFATTADGASSPTERMTISANGKVSVSSSIAAGENIASFTNSSATGNGIFTSVNSDGTSYVFFQGYSASATANRILIYTNGNVVNANNSYGAISDIKLKENIVDANSQWDDLKALQVRNYNFKEGQTHTQIGLIAQEVELVSPGLVTESPDRDEEGNDLGTVTKSVNYSVLYMKAVKALQEAMERIETLEQRLNDAGIA